MRKEPYFMQQLHKQREREARIFLRRFKGDFNTYWQWTMGRLEKGLKEQGYRVESGKRGIGRIVKERTTLGKKMKAPKK